MTRLARAPARCDRPAARYTAPPPRLCVLLQRLYCSCSARNGAALLFRGDIGTPGRRRQNIAYHARITSKSLHGAAFASIYLSGFCLHTAVYPPRVCPSFMPVHYCTLRVCTFSFAAATHYLPFLLFSAAACSLRRRGGATLRARGTLPVWRRRNSRTIPSWRRTACGYSLPGSNACLFCLRRRGCRRRCAALPYLLALPARRRRCRHAVLFERHRA